MYCGSYGNMTRPPGPHPSITNTEFLLFFSASAKRKTRYFLQFTLFSLCTKMPGNDKDAEATIIPDDIRNLKDFPCYDESFQDGPRFRQNLSSWAGKTEKVATKTFFSCL